VTLRHLDLCSGIRRGPGTMAHSPCGQAVRDRSGRESRPCPATLCSPLSASDRSGGTLACVRYRGRASPHTTGNLSVHQGIAGGSGAYCYPSQPWPANSADTLSSSQACVSSTWNGIHAHSLPNTPRSSAADCYWTVRSAFRIVGKIGLRPQALCRDVLDTDALSIDESSTCAWLDQPGKAHHTRCSAWSCPVAFQLRSLLVVYQMQDGGDAQ